MRLILSFAIITLFVSCKSEKKLTDEELMEQSARTYFFMGDSVEVEVTILDTIYTDELTETLDMIDANISLVQQDIDTLNTMMDDLVYNEDTIPVLKAKTYHQVCCEDAKRTETLLGYQLKLKDLNMKKLEFKNSSRLFLHLKRSIWANIAGYEANVHYQLNDEVADIKVLMDADFNIVD
jgi:hypothetical protein